MKSVKLDPVVKKELRFMALSLLICTVVLQLGFWLVSLWVESVLWDYTVALGGVLGFCLAMLNFFLMCLAVQRSVSDPDPRQAQLRMKASYSRRSVLILAVLILAFVVKQIHWLPVAAAVFYPTVVIYIRQLWTKYVLKRSDDPPAGTVSAPAEPAEDADAEEDEFEKAISRFAGKIDTDYLKQSGTEDKSEEKSDADEDIGTKEG